MHLRLQSADAGLISKENGFMFVIIFVYVPLHEKLNPWKSFGSLCVPDWWPAGMRFEFQFMPQRCSVSQSKVGQSSTGLPKGLDENEIDPKELCKSPFCMFVAVRYCPIDNPTGVEKGIMPLDLG